MCLKQVLRETESLCPSSLHLSVRAQPGTLPSLPGCCGWHLPTLTCDLPPGTAAILTSSFAEQRLLELMCFLHGSDKPQGTLPSCLLLTARLCRASEARKQSSPEAQCSLAGIPGDSRQAENSHRAQLPSHLMVAWGRREQPCAKPRESEDQHPFENANLPSLRPAQNLHIASPPSPPEASASGGAAWTP